MLPQQTKVYSKVSKLSTKVIWKQIVSGQSGKMKWTLAEAFQLNAKASLCLLKEGQVYINGSLNGITIYILFNKQHVHS
jgi:hypothetical protein